MVLRVAIIAGEESGDQLGAEFIASLRSIYQKPVELAGIGGKRMAKAGLKSFFPLSEIALMGISAVLARLPKIIRLAYRLVDHIVAFQPDILVIIDSPDFTHPVARRVRRKLPNLPVVDYVSPSVWAWRSGRARKMKSYIDHVMAILPFEPVVYQRLKGPPCTYVGHPLVEKLQVLKGSINKSNPAGPAKLLVMPGSRTSEIGRLLPVFGKALEVLKKDMPELEAELPAVTHLKDSIFQETRNWPAVPRIIEGERAKFEAFSRCDAALAASGTATLELALWGVPMVVAYKLDAIAKRLKWLGQVDSIVLPNLILGENIVPEFIDEACTPEALARASLPLLKDSAQRKRQLSAFEQLGELCSVTPHKSADLAAGLALSLIKGQPQVS